MFIMCMMECLLLYAIEKVNIIPPDSGKVNNIFSLLKSVTSMLNTISHDHPDS